MLKKLSFLVSMPFMAVLMIFLIVVLALATFVESAYNTQTAGAVVYGTHWFELLMLLIGINLVGVMVKQKLFRRKKIVVLLFHLAFILILLGASITRFISYEGNMHIRENAASNLMLSDNAYIDVVLEANGETSGYSREVILTDLTPHDYRMSASVGGEKIKIKSTEYMTSVMEQYSASPGGEPYLQVMLVTDRQTSAGIPSGTIQEVMGMKIGFNLKDTTAMINFYSEGEEIWMVAPFTVSVIQMGGNGGEEYDAGETIPIHKSTLYAMGQMRMALQDFIPSARKQIVRAPAGQMGSHLGAVKLEIRYRGMATEVYVPGLAGLAGRPVEGSMGDLRYTVTYGSKEIQLPFSLFLKNFEVERYPGSNSPSSFASDVVLLDKEMGIQEERRIFMNNVLKHRGYRFYQSSYDNDELGTILSVNRDWAGTFITYLGYLVLIAGMVVALFVPGTRFAMIARRSSPVARSIAMIMLLLGGSLSLFSQEVPPNDVAKDFGYLWVQDKGGRFKPMNTLSNEVVRKITKHARYESYTADQVLLGMIIYPEVWQHKELFKVKHPELHRLVGYKGEMVSFNDMMDSTGSYLLSDLVNEAYAKQVAQQSELDREVIKLDDRLNAFYLVQSGGLIRIFPDHGADNHKWASVSEALLGQMNHQEDTMKNVFLRYLSALQQSDYGAAGIYVDQINENQLSGEILPSESKKKMEIIYNRINIFPLLARFYGLFGIIMMALSFLVVFRPHKIYKNLFRVGVIHLVVALVAHTVALAVRWYISGHAPMSNGYESMIFVSWVTLLAGLIFVKRSGYALALTAILSALSLMVAGMSNMNPEITNLVPVLKSPWLTIHVAVIMAGYGFLGLASFMGLLNIVLYAVLNTSNKSRLEEVIQQVTNVNNLTLIVGLYFMTAGVFLGGVWANESWGRYWGWDPKETWALITVLVYAFVAHMHRIPGLRGRFAFNLATFISYSSVMMTYFGVNYFLGGIHSYASGSSFKVPLWAYLVLLLLVGLSLFAYRIQQKMLPERSPQDS
ncbi:MAG: cytochrome c biogenesis protein CcsA [Bacteroidales bacterium]|nr:cytochrome c biogenesis protein CcsA [Bacteroidales bacterium]